MGLKTNEAGNSALLATLVDSGRFGRTARLFLLALLSQVPHAAQGAFAMEDLMRAVQAADHTELR